MVAVANLSHRTGGTATGSWQARAVEFGVLAVVWPPGLRQWLHFLHALRRGPATSGYGLWRRGFTLPGRRRPSQPVLAQGDSGSPGLLIQRQVQALSDGLIAAVTLAGCHASPSAGPWDAIQRVLIGREGQYSGADAGPFKTLRLRAISQRRGRAEVP